MFKRLLTKRPTWFVLAIATFSVITLSTPHLQSHRTSLSSSISPTYTISLQQEAQATSGGRSSGGSFGKSGGSSDGGSSGGRSPGGKSSGSRSSGSRSSGSRSSNDRTSDNYSNNRGYARSRRNSSDDEAVLKFLFTVLWLVIVVGLLFLLIKKVVLNTLNFLSRTLLAVTNPKEYKAQQVKKRAQEKRKEAQAKAVQALFEQNKEIVNDIVTVTQVQVAIYGEARQVQRSLNKITTDHDWSTEEGLNLSLTKTALTLLRASEYWSHASAHSQTMHTREAAKQQFDRLSIEERRKFDVESLVNIRGSLKREAINHPEQESADYIVITMIVGTAHDKPLLKDIHTIEELNRVLKLLGTLPPSYLMVYEMLWSPQDESDCLTYDELLLNYPDMYQIS